MRRHKRNSRLVDPAALAHARPAPLPDAIEPQTARRAREVPRGSGWLYETKLEGVRVLARVAARGVRLLGVPNGLQPRALERALAALPLDAALLDGQLVALRADGTSSLRQLRDAFATGTPGALVYEVFDLLHLDGFDLTDVELVNRKRALKTVLTGGGALSNRGVVRYVHHFEGSGRELYAEVCRLGLPGLVCKLRTSRYRGGASAEWVDLDCADCVHDSHGEKARIERPRLVSAGYVRSRPAQRNERR